MMLKIKLGNFIKEQTLHLNLIEFSFFKDFFVKYFNRYRKILSILGSLYYFSLLNNMDKIIILADININQVAFWIYFYKRFLNKKLKLNNFYLNKTIEENKEIFNAIISSLPKYHIELGKITWEKLEKTNLLIYIGDIFDLLKLKVDLVYLSNLLQWYNIENIITKIKRSKWKNIFACELFLDKIEKSFYKIPIKKVYFKGKIFALYYLNLPR